MSFRLSPNEQAAVLRQERDRRRKLRIQQVREQERQFAQKVRKDVRQRKAVELKVLSEQLEDGWSKEQHEKANNLRLLYEKNLEHIGEGHRAAASQKPQEGQRAAAAVLNKKAAQGRYNAALDKLRDEQDVKHQKENAHILSRLTALEIEKSRAAKIASLPAPVKETVEEVKPGPPVKCVEDFSTTHYHVAAEYVEKAEPHEQGDAKAAAAEEEQRLKEEHLETVREEKERKEKAILRHKHAHKRELLDQDMGRLMEELGQMEQADRRRRQAVVAKIPHQVFQPPHRRLVEREEHQVNLEQAFEDMYMANTEYTGDLTLALEPRVPHHDADLDLTADDLSSELPGGITLQPPDAVSSHSRALQDQNGTSGKPLSRKETLQKLMRKIQGQRQDWREKSVQDLSMKPPGPEGIQSLPRDNAKQKRQKDAVQSAPRLNEGSTSTLTSSDGSSRQGRDKNSELSEHPISNGDMNSQGSQEDRLTEEDNMSEPIISGSPSLFHPMELAAKLRSLSKMPDMSQLQKQQHQLMKKDEEHRQRLAQQQLDAHSDQHKHLQVLQRNLEERQQALDRQIKGYGVRRHPTHQSEGVSEAGRSQHMLDTHLGESEQIQQRQASHLAGIEQPQQAQASHLAESERPQQTMISHLADALPREIHQHSPAEIPSGTVGMTSPASMIRSSQRLGVNGEMPEQHEIPQVSTGQRQSQEEIPQNSESSPNVHVTDLFRHSKNVSRFPNPAVPVTAETDPRAQRIRNYQLQLLSQQRQNRSSLLEAQARLQQRRLNLMKEYPDLKLPKYTPYVSQIAVPPEPNVIYSKAEKELGPVPIAADASTPADDGIDELGIHSNVREPRMEQSTDRHMQSSDPQHQPHGFPINLSQGTESGHVMPERIDQTAPQSFLEQQGFSLSQNTQGTESGHAMQEQIGQRTPQYFLRPDEQQGFSIPQPSFATVSNNQINIPNIVTTEEASEQTQGSQGTTGYRTPHQSETTESGGIEAHTDDLTKEQITFREFLRAQREKLELKNKEHQEQLRLKQEQLREQIKRQMEQYRDSSLERERFETDSYATEAATPLILPPPYSDISRPEPPNNLPSVVSTGSQNMQVPSSYPGRPHHRPPPLSRLVTNPIVEMHPHELSTIIEVDTPRSERQSIGGRPAMINNLPAGRQLIYQSSSGFEISQVDVKNQSGLDEDGSKSSQLLSTHSMNDSSFPERSTAIPDTEVALHSSVLREDLLSVLRNDYNRGTTMLESLHTQDHHDFSEVADPFAAKVKEQDYDAHLKACHSMTDNDEQAHVTGYENSATSHLDSTDQDLRTADGRRFDALMSLPSIRPPNENIPESTLASGNYPSVDGLIGPDGSSTAKGDKRAASVDVGDGFTMYSHDVGRGVISYPSSKMPLPSNLSVADHTRAANQGSINLPPSHAHSASDTALQPVIEIFQPTVDNLPSTMDNLPPTMDNLPTTDRNAMFEYTQQFAARSTGSGSSTSSLGNNKNNATTKFISPKVTTHGSFGLLPFSVGGGEQIETSANLGDLNVNNSSLTQHRTAHFDETGHVRQSGETPPHSRLTFDNTNVGSENFQQWGITPHQDRTADLSRLHALSVEKLERKTTRTVHESFGVKWKDVLFERHHEQVPLADQSQVSSVLSEHPTSFLSTGVLDQSRQQSLQHKQTFLQENTSFSSPGMRRIRQHGDILIAGVANVDLQELAGPDETTLTQHSIRDSTVASTLDHDEAESFAYANQDVVPKSVPSPSHAHGNLELSDHTLDPSYSTSFLQFPTDSQTVQTGDVSTANIAHSRFSNPATAGSHMPHATELDVGHHGVVLQSRDLNTTPLDPSRDSASSVEAARVAAAPDVPNYLMPMFSDVSISQRSMSFGSEQDQESGNQGQRLAEVTTISDRYSLPWLHVNNRDAMQTGLNMGHGDAEMIQRWQEQIADQVSEDISDSQFQQLHEITSSTQQGDQHGITAEAGILEEPDLTLVSLNTTHCSTVPDSQQKPALEPPSDENLMSSSCSELIDVEMSNLSRSSEVKENIQPAYDSPALSLQEAFQRRKAAFIQASRTRVEEAQVRAKNQAATAVSTTVRQPRNKSKPSKIQSNAKQSGMKTSKASHATKKSKTNILKENQAESSVVDTTSSSRASSRNNKVDNKTRSSTRPNQADTSSSEASSRGSKTGNKTQNRTRTRADRKAAEKEMYKRTGRLYNQLEEVKQRKVESQRKEQYAAYRQKRKEFEQKLQTRLNKWSNQKNDT